MTLTSSKKESLIEDGVVVVAEKFVALMKSVGVVVADVGVGECWNELVDIVVAVV